MAVMLSNRTNEALNPRLDTGKTVTVISAPLVRVSLK